jgi:hypothetical protein
MPETRKYIREFEREFRSSYISVSWNALLLRY